MPRFPEENSSTQRQPVPRLNGIFQTSGRKQVIRLFELRDPRVAFSNSEAVRECATPLGHVGPWLAAGSDMWYFCLVKNLPKKRKMGKITANPGIFWKFNVTFRHICFLMMLLLIYLASLLLTIFWGILKRWSFFKVNSKSSGIKRSTWNYMIYWVVVSNMCFFHSRI